MNAVFEDARWPACLSAFRLDCFRLGELPADEEASVREHLVGCARCRTAADALAADEADFHASAPPLRRPRRGRTRAVAAGLGVAALAAGLLLTLRPADTGERSKGAPLSLGMYVLHGQKVRRALPGEAVVPGDAVRFSYSSPEPRYLALLSLDGAGGASVYFPAGPDAVRMPAAVDSPLPLGTQLDAVLGAETVVALFCERPLALEPVRQALQARGAEGLEVSGCQLATFHFTKRAP